MQFSARECSDSMKLQYPILKTSNILLSFSNPRLFYLTLHRCENILMCNHRGFLDFFRFFPSIFQLQPEYLFVCLSYTDLWPVPCGQRSLNIFFEVDDST